MPLTQEKRLDNNFTNNNDNSYLHKKFKKMASTISVYSNNTARVGDTRNKNLDGDETARNSYITNGSIQAAHPEIEKIKGLQNQNSKDVQINISDENTRLSDVNNVDKVSGKTSSNDEFSNKTENLENDFRDVQSGGTGGRYVCPYCKLSCAKPSVLQKHIRAHTNERPYPCIPCGFAFKTKSNLYKHKRSRTHALRSRGADVSATINEEDNISGGSESDTSLPPSTISDSGTDMPYNRLENSRRYEFSSPELTNDRTSPPTEIDIREGDTSKSKTIYKPKFRVAYQDPDEKDKIMKTISSNADFLTEHISKIISNNEAIVDVIETPLQKKYGKIKQIAESKQFLHEHEIKTEPSPLNLTKNSNESDSIFRKRSHSESFSQTDHQKHPLNPEGSIIKDLLLKTKGNGLTSATGEVIDGPALLYICPLCQIVYKSAENLEIHRLYYCKGNFSNNNTLIGNVPKETKLGRPENVYVRSNSINVRLPETSTYSSSKLSVFNNSPPLKVKPDNLVIIKPETNDVVAPLPSPGPLLGNTRLVDTRAPYDYNRKTESMKAKPMLASPKRRIDCGSDLYSPKLPDNISPRSSDLYSQAKIRCIEANPTTLRAMDDLSQLGRHNSTSLQMFGGEVKIVHHSGSTTTLRIEPSKNQLSPILIHPNLSPSKLSADMEASSVVVRSELHSGGTIVHNPPTPKEVTGTPKPQTPRISVSSGISNNLPNIHDMTHFQFPPLSAITAYNPLTLPPLSPSSSPNGATTILHGGKLIPHVPGIPGPNTPGTNVTTLSKNASDYFGSVEPPMLSTRENMHTNILSVNGQTASIKYEINKTETIRGMRNSSSRTLNLDMDKLTPKQLNVEVSQYVAAVPIINIRNVDEPNVAPKGLSNIKTMTSKQDVAVKRNSDGIPKTLVLKENSNFLSVKTKYFEPVNTPRSAEIKEIRNFNFENLITKAEIFNNQIPSSGEVQKNTNAQEMAVSSNNNERSETAYFQKNVVAKSMGEDRKPKFLRPSTLPLKPGTFTPKRHHGITPNANTMPLVSPETPRPAKAYGQLYLNGNAYTYLGLKCSTKVFYCTINRPQPTYVPNQHFLSMYSNWQLLSELTPDPLGLSASSAMSLYDSRHRPQNVASSVLKHDLILTHSSQWNKVTKESKQSLLALDPKKADENKLLITDNAITPKKELAGGFESNEEYTYVRGRGRGRYVCSECGIRCKKPSMLKKHIRTHTDVRPYTCVHCAFSFKTKGNLTKHMKSKAHFKKCCELGINPNEGNDADGGEMAPGSGETDDDSESDGDEGNEGETESSDTEVCKSRLPEHEAAHCLLSLGSSRPATSATPGLITSARPSTYPYTPTGLETTTSELSPDKFSLSRSTSVDSRTDADNEPMDLSKNDVKVTANIPEIPTARESSVLASLASNTAKLPHNQTHWSNGEPMLHTYLTERALQDSKIKQSQLTSSLSKLKKVELEKNPLIEGEIVNANVRAITTTKNCISTCISSAPINVSTSKVSATCENNSLTPPINVSKDNIIAGNDSSLNNLVIEAKRTRTPSSSNAENAKHVVSEYLKHARINLIKTYDENSQSQPDKNNDINITKMSIEEREDINNTDEIKMSSLDHDPIARKVVIGAGGVAFKVTKGKEFEGSSSYSPGRLMEDGRRVCDFCNKTFTKPSQLRLHLNIHYMERPFRCSACAVSFRTRGHLQKHERSGSHHNKVSMTSTFGAATSLNPRPFRCSDCNIAFRIHGHLAKHLRSKMHVMRLECLFKLPFGTFTEIERAGVSLTDIDTTDCASSLASLQSLARKLHEKDPSKLEYREPSAGAGAPPDCSDDEDPADNACDSERDSEMKTIENSDELDRERS